MSARRFRRFTGLLAVLIMAGQTSPVLCVAAVCLQPASHAAEARATDAEQHANHSHDYDPGQRHEDSEPSDQLPAAADCQAMALCTVAFFDAAVELTEAPSPVAGPSGSPARSIFLSRSATPDTPPPRA